MKKILLLVFASMCWLARAGAQTATVTPSSSVLNSAGGQITFFVSLVYPADVSAVGLAAKPPAATWVHVSTGGTTAPDVKPEVGERTDPTSVVSEFGWTYSSPPANSASFSFVLSYPQELPTTGNQVITFSGHYRRNGVLTPITVAAVTLTPTPVAPAITTQPASVTVASGANATFTVVASGIPTPTLKWQRSTNSGSAWSDLVNDSIYSGVTTGTLTVTAATLTMNGNRFRAVATNTDSSANSDGLATLTVTQSPVITVQPLGQSVLVSGSATFAVTATGSGTLAYQWFFTPASSSTPQSISGATAASYTLSNAQSVNTGDYVCVVSNGVGTAATSVAAQLTIVPRAIKVVSVTAAPGATAVVAVQLLASGAENALGFSLSFDPTQLTYASAVVGTQAADATLNPNASQATAGRIGFAMSKPSNVVWSGGTQEIVKITFTVNAALANGTVAALTFGNVPIAREISDALANELPGGYQNGAVTVLAGFEADMNGNGTVSITDWVKVGRIVAGLDPAPTGVDFLKADCAPKSSLGNGTLSITDWVQAGRYAAGLDPLTPVGGPSATAP